MSVIVWEAMYAGSYSARTALQDFALRVQVEWLVRILVLTSMMLQLVLVVLGARRYLSSSGILRFMVWGAYISADAVAISALGTMIHSDRREFYGIWAPMLLMHLGGPDAITAYSMADNELWLRHVFNMVYQVSMAVYVIYASSLKGYPLAAAILLLLVGSIKYGERTLALRHGNCLRIVMSNLSISQYMEIKSVAEKRKYVIMGEDQPERMIEQKQASSSRKRKGIKEELETSSVKEKGRKEELEMSSLKGQEIVTIEDVKSANIDDRAYGLCLSYALFRMYKRKLGSSYFFEGDQQQARAFWVERSREEAFRSVEMELKFMYDAVFFKYGNPGFTKWGMIVRVVNTILLGAAGYLILGVRESRQAQRTVTYVVILVALVVEIFQLWRVIVSDWTRVRLICAYVVGSKRRESHTVKWCRLKVIKITMVALGTLEDFVGRNRYWSNQIPQHCLIETWLNRSPLMCKMAGFFPKPDSFIVSWYIKQRHTHHKHVEDDLKEFIFGILKEICSQKNSNEKCKENVYNFGKNLFQGEPEILEVLESHGNLEEVILMWHIATTLYDRQRELPRQNETEELPRENETEKELSRQNETEKELSQQNETEKNASRSGILSRYCAYLLLSRPNLLPLRPEMIRTVYMELVNQLLDTVTLGSILEKNPGDLSGCKYNLLSSGAKLAELLMKKREEGEMWKLLAEYWGKLVIYMAVYNKAIFHAECVAAGGEFLSLVWVLLGHMGCGEQSDSAAADRTLSDLRNELDAVKKKLSDRENELAARERALGDPRAELTAAKTSRGSEIEPARTN